ncbi:hypothetical protein BRC92_12030 [Halobacteriales archaeon QS_4_69_31]|jgi:hypothetical protein|nr:MAG: hypothetical protein BRC92_12030 [Halobacteriales archaeon QS_4_69_31]
MPADGDLYVLGPGGDGDGSEKWVSPRPVDEVVVDVLTDETELSADEIDDLDAYVDRDDLAASLDGETEVDTLRFEVEGHEVVVETDGTVDVAD